MTPLTPVSEWKNSPKTLLSTDYNFASNFNRQNQDLLNQGEFVKGKIQVLEGIFGSISAKISSLSLLNDELESLLSSINPVLKIENDELSGRLTATDAAFASITTNRLTAEQNSTQLESKIKDIELDVKVQRLNPLLTELNTLSKFNDRNLTVSGGSYAWSTYAGVRSRPTVNLLMENQPQGSNAGSVNTPSLWEPRRLNTIKSLGIDRSNLTANNRIELPPGNYAILGFGLSAGCSVSRMGLIGDAVLATGVSNNILSDGGNVGATTTFVAPLFTALSLTKDESLSLSFIAGKNHGQQPTMTEGRGANFDTENFAQLLIISLNPDAPS